MQASKFLVPMLFLLVLLPAGLALHAPAAKNANVPVLASIGIRSLSVEH